MADRNRRQSTGASAGTQEERAVGLTTPVVAWLVQRMKEDPQFLEKLREESEKAERSEPGAPDGESLDDVLSRLTHLLEGGPGAKPQPSQPAPDDGQSSKPAPGLPSVVDGQGMDLCRFRELLATELYYMQMVPPIEPEALIDLHSSIRDFLDTLKLMKRNPYLRELLTGATARTHANGAGDGARSAEGDQEVVQLVERMARDVVAPGEERVLPAVAALIGAAATAAGAGTLIGRAVHQVVR